MTKFEHKKSLGQHFLNSDYVPKQMCDAAGLVGGSEAAAHTTVLEIGPGTGALTREILARGAKVVAIEADARAISTLEEIFVDEIARGQLTIYHHDARDLSELSQFGLTNHSYICISNIPYYLSGLLFRQLLDTECQPKSLVFLIQKELAERIARDTKASLLSLSVRAFGTPSYICTIKKGHFTPPPKVDSAILAVRDISRSNFLEITSPDFFHLLHLGFGQKRKQLLSNLVQGEVGERTKIIDAFHTLHLKETVRAEDITITQWIDLAKLLLLIKNQ